MTKNLTDELQTTARQALVGLHPSRPGVEAGGLPFRRLLSAVFRARYLIFATTLIGLLAGAFLAITTANSYVSTGKFLFTASGAEATRVASSRAPETSKDTIGTAATYILSTDDLLKRVVDRVTPERILAPCQPGNPDVSAAKALFYKIQRDWNATRAEEVTAEEALKQLRKTLAIERPRDTDVLVATCIANEPRLAQEILAVYLDEAVRWHIEKYEDLAAYDAAEKAASEGLDLEPEYEKLDSTLQSSLKKIEDASLPLEKDAPNRGRLMLAGMFIGLFFGFGMVLLLALPDKVVRTRNDLEGIEGLAVIGVMPRLDSRNIKRHSFRRRRGR